MPMILSSNLFRFYKITNSLYLVDSIFVLTLDKVEILCSNLMEKKIT